jgi:filamentous hemagglutinin family protein
MKKMTKLLIYFVLFINNSAYAEITTDGTTGAIQHLSGQMTIPQSLGTTAGNNLFHSFQTFNINTGETATFTGDAALKNVISRVTGGQVSNIDGLLKSNVGNANFYFINPAGVTFGANAQVDVPAAFHLSTANAVRFSNGDSFSSSLSGASTLSVADPVGFGFLNNQVGDIQIQDSWLKFKEGSSVSLSAANLSIDNSWLEIPAGTLQVNAVGDTASEVSLKTPASSAFSGSIQMSTDSLFNVTGSKAGLLILRAGDVGLSQSSLLADSRGNTANTLSGIDILAKTINLVGDKTIISSTAFAKGNAGAIAIKSDDLTLRYGSAIRSDAYNSGHAGDIHIDTHSLTVNGQTVTTGIFSEVFNNPQHLPTQAGNIYINSDNILLQQAGVIKTSSQTQTNAGDITLHATQKISINGEGESATGIFSNTQSKQQGNSGNISLTANELWIENAGQVNTNTSSFGHAGNIDIATKNIFISSNFAEPTGISSLSSATAQGTAANAGSINMTTDRLALFLGGFIKSNAESKSNAGNIAIFSKEFVINGLGSAVDTGIFSNSLNKATGNAGNIQLTGDKLSLLSNANISSDGSLLGNAGDITLKIGAMLLDGDGNFARISSNAFFDMYNHDIKGQSSAGNIKIDTNNLSLLSGGSISSYINGTGNAGSVTIGAKDILIDGRGQTAGIFNNSQLGTDTKGSSLYLKADNLRIQNGGQIGSSVVYGGKAGDIKVDVRNTVIDGQGSHWETGFFSDVTFDSTNAAAGGGSVTINGDQLTVLNGGKISSKTFSLGKAGNITLNVGDILIDRQNATTDTGVFTDAQSTSTGKAGYITIIGNNLTLLGGGEISSNTDARGDAGDISINSKNILMDGKNGGANLTGINSDASLQSTGGSAGSISVISDSLILNNGAQITGDTHAKGDAKTVTVNTKDLTLSNGGAISSSARAGSGNAGDVNVTANNTLIDGQNNPAYTGIFSDSYQGSSGKAGTVEITNANNLTLRNLGQISSSAWNENNAGDLRVNSNNLAIDGKDSGIFAAAHNLGQSGKLDIKVNQLLTVTNQGKISIENTPIQNTNAVNNLATPPLGALTITSAKLELNNGIITAKTTGNMDAGSININATQALLATNHSSINSSTSGLGSAGKITVTAPAITLSNSDISSEASITSGGQTGNVFVTAEKGIYLSQNSRISMKDDATIANPNALTPTFVKVSAPDINLKDSQITTAATGNVNGGDIELHFSHWLTLDPSIIQTTAKDGSGGMITVTGGELIKLQNSAFFTSVTGETGNGGTINVSANTLILDNGAIQANAEGGAGGDINLNLQNLIPSENQLIKGGAQVIWQAIPQGLNVIQAASETGVNGTVNVNSPQFNISGSMSGLDTSSLALPALKPNPCQDSVGFASSLVRGGNGGIPNNEAKMGFIPAAVVLPNSKPSSSKISLASQQQAAYTASQKNNNYSCAALSIN